EAASGAIVARSATDGTRAPLGESDSGWITGDGGIVFWQERGRGVVGVDLASWSRFEAPGAPIWFTLQDGTIVWDAPAGEDFREVHAASIRPLLPGAPRPEPATDPNVTWHP